MFSTQDSKEKHFNRVYMETYGKLFAVFVRLIQDEDRVKDVLQQVYIRIWERWDVIQDKENLQPLIYKSAKNLIIDEMRKNKRIILKHTETQQEIYHYQTAEDQYILKEYKVALDKIVAKMPARRKEVYLLSRERGMSHQKISEHLSISKNTIERHMQDALKSVREELKTHFSYSVLPLLILQLVTDLI